MRIGVLIAEDDRFYQDADDCYHHRYVRCCDCDTIYRVVGGKARCNNQVIVTCPWCGPESTVNRMARGTFPRMRDACQTRTLATFTVRYPIGAALRWNMCRSSTLYIELIETASSEGECPLEVSRSAWSGEVAVDGEEFVVTLTEGPYE
jgi:hypothetical protein